MKKRKSPADDPKTLADMEAIADAMDAGTLVTSPLTPAEQARLDRVRAGPFGRGFPQSAVPTTVYPGLDSVTEKLAELASRIDLPDPDRTLVIEERLNTLDADLIAAGEEGLSDEECATLIEEHQNVTQKQDTLERQLRALRYREPEVAIIAQPVAGLPLSDPEAQERRRIWKAEMRAKWTKTGQKAGRPKVGAGSKQISVSIEIGLLADTDTLCAELGKSRSALIAEALKFYIRGVTRLREPRLQDLRTEE